ncbi:MAG: autotransporter-associated beta strand repeat-containing protein [Kiritimatiellia bacterium]
MTTGNNDGSATYGGILSGVNASLLKRGGGTQTLTGNNTFSGGVEVNNGTLAVSSVTTAGVAQPLGMGVGDILFSGPAGLSITGAGAYSFERGLILADNFSTLTVAGTVTHTAPISGGGSSATLIKVGAGTYNQSATGAWNSNIFITEGTWNVTPSGSINNAGVIQVSGGATFNIGTSTQVRGSSVDIISGTVNLDAGTLRTNGLSVAGGSAFNWSAGTITMQTDASGSSGSTDRRAPGSSLSALPVYEGRIVSVTGMASLAVPAGGTLDLGLTYGSLGMRYDQFQLAGSLDLSSADNTLVFEFNPFFFRPSSFGVDGAGTLILIDATALNGTFETFTGVVSDYIGFSAAPGSGSVVGTLGMSTLNPLTDIPQNTYYLEYETDSGNLLFHYHLTATIPEPASAGLLVAGGLLLRVLGRRKRGIAAG